MILTDEEALAAREKGRTIGQLCLTSIMVDAATIMVDAATIVELCKTPIRELHRDDLAEIERKAEFINEQVTRLREAMRVGGTLKKQVKAAYGKDA